MKTYIRVAGLIGGCALVLAPAVVMAQVNNVVINQSQNQAVQWAMSHNPNSMVYFPQYYCNGYYSYSPCQQAQYQNYTYTYPQQYRQQYYPQYSQSSYASTYTYSYPSSYYYPTSYTYPTYRYGYNYTYDNSSNYNYGYDTYAYNHGNNGYYAGDYNDYCGCGYDSSGQMWAY